MLEKYVQETLRQCPVDAINLPEIADENFRGEPFYRNLDPREFAMVLRKQLGPQEIIANKIVVHLEGGPEALARWTRATQKEYGIANIVAVGGSSSRYRYPGPTVLEANALMREHGLLCGNIMIPERREEARRMLQKTERGADFFTTQVIFAPDNLLKVLAAYDERCRERGVTPATVFVSFAPVSDGDDLDFLRWLGVDIGPETTRRLTSQGTGGIAASSVDLAVANWEHILAQNGAFRRVSLGLNVEYINRHNFRHAPEMGARLMEVG
ncbi:MAG: hypothetical protein ACE5LS_06885 [Thermoplasmata archaeon]